MVRELINRLFALYNLTSYWKSSFELQEAVNSASEDMYLQYRGSLAWYRPNNNIPAITPGETIATTDALQECYQVIEAEGVPLVVESSEFILDQVQSLEVQWSQDGPLYPVLQLPDNQYLRMVNSRSLPPTEATPYGRLRGTFTFDIAPSNYYRVYARTLCFPPPCAFTFGESVGIVPEIIVERDLIWLDDKIEPLVSRVIQKLGLNVSNPVLVQTGTAMEAKIG